MVRYGQLLLTRNAFASFSASKSRYEVVYCLVNCGEPLALVCDGPFVELNKTGLQVEVGLPFQGHRVGESSIESIECRHSIRF